jgi:hypothetical protein
VGGIGAAALLETGDAWSIASRFQDFSVQSSMVAMSRMSREMRALKNDSAVLSASAAQFSFIGTDNNTVGYNRSGNTLMRNSDGLADNVSALTFTYYNDSGGVIAAPLVGPNNTNIRRIAVDYSLLGGTRTLNFRFQVRPQNLRRLNEKFK